MTNTCTGCGGSVPARRPSKTGQHWCTKTECQNLKQRYYRSLRKGGGEVSVVAQQTFVHLAVHAPRVPCPSCGLVDAVRGYMHRAVGNPVKPCRGVGSAGANVGLEWLDVIHPEQAPVPEPEVDNGPEVDPAYLVNP